LELSAGRGWSKFRKNSGKGQPPTTQSIRRPNMADRTGLNSRRGGLLQGARAWEEAGFQIKCKTSSVASIFSKKEEEKLQGNI